MPRDSDGDIEVEITFLTTEEGGRKGYAESRYCPQYVIDDQRMTGGAHMFIERQRVYPGESAKAKVWFLGFDVIPGTMWLGKRIRVQEADKLVAHAIVTEIYNEDLQAPS